MDNILKNIKPYSLTISGTGNLNLTFSDIEKLIDGNTTSSGVIISSADVLFLEIDFGNRLKLETLQFYVGGISFSSFIDASKVFYKNYTTDTYQLLDLNYDTKVYLDNIPNNFAPKNLLLTVSGASLELYEIKALADSSYVKFGVNGTETFKNIEAFGEYSEPLELMVYNNNDKPANAFATLDYNINDVDYRLKISNNIEGPYYGLYDGVILKDNNRNNRYIWNDGILDNVVVSDSKVMLNNRGDGSWFANNTFNTSPNLTINQYSVIKWATVDQWNSATFNLKLDNKDVTKAKKFYHEFKINNLLVSSNGCFLGFCSNLTTDIRSVWIGSTSNYSSYGFYNTDGSIRVNNNTGSYAGPLAFNVNDVISFLVDFENNKVWLAKNGVWYGNMPAGTGYAWDISNINTIYPAISIHGVGGSVTLNIGQQPFDYPNCIPGGARPSIDAITYKGCYTTPILEIEDINTRSYFNSTIYTDNSTNISLLGLNDKSIIEIQSSDNKPINLDLVALIYRYNLSSFDRNLCSRTYNLYKNILGQEVVSYGVSTNHQGTVYCSFVNNKLGVYATFWNRAYYNDKYITKTNILRGTNFDHVNVNLDSSAKIKFDVGGGIWAYESSTFKLRHKNSDFSNTDISNKTLSYNSLFDFSPEPNGYGVWYTDSNDNRLIHLDSNCNILNNISLNRPRALCSTKDGGCLVIDDADFKIYKYFYNGSLAFNINIQHKATLLVEDDEGGFWYYSSSGVLFNYNINGNKRLEIPLASITYIQSGHDLLLAYSSSNKTVYIINKTTGTILWNYYLEYQQTNPILFSLSIDDETKHEKVFPLSYDPIWGNPNYLKWNTFDLNSSFLPECKYHRIKYTLKTDSTSKSPELISILAPRVIKIGDILPNSSRPIYLKSYYPKNEISPEYTTNVRCWWYIEDEGL